MTPKEKAKELYDKMYSLNEDDFISEYISKATALIAVNEIQNLPNMNYSNNKDLSQYDYWQEVKQEIEKL